MTTTKGKFRQSFAWWAFANAETDAEALLRHAAEIGYQGVEMIPQEHWPLVRDMGLTIATFAGHQSIREGLNRRDNWPRIQKELREHIALAEKWGLPNLIVFAGSQPNEAGDLSGVETTAEHLRAIAKTAEDAGVTLVLELLNSKVDHPEYKCDRTAWGLKVIEAVGSPRVRLLYDIYHMQIMEGDIIRTIEAHGEHFAHYHTAGNPGRRDLDSEQELYYPPIMAAIAATGYDGFVGQEFRPKGDAVAALRHAFTVCHVPATD
jgi:hydroxypyruvate isomerase